ncbi:MAG: hypothetical protein JWR23_1189 [Mucilaginibacter sp.]|nr:hypothetical protein [Mucilaginibacter sp.]
MRIKMKEPEPAQNNGQLSLKVYNISFYEFNLFLKKLSSRNQG